MFRNIYLEFGSSEVIFEVVFAVDSKNYFVVFVVDSKNYLVLFAVDSSAAVVTLESYREG